MSELGFIILRHVNSKLTNIYWQKCYERIRSYYPENDIVIIDDNSDEKFLTNRILYKTKIIKSEYPKRGELLPYYYYLQNKFFDNAVILHDSVFLNRYIDFNVSTYKYLWHFYTNVHDHVKDEIEMLRKFNDDELLKYHESKKWTGCFGCMCVIRHDFLVKVNQKYEISKLLDCVLSRYNRCSLERVLACILEMHHKNNSIFGNISHYYKNNIKFANFKLTFNKWKGIWDPLKLKEFNKLPVIKIFSGR